jgi:hypothetical protein
MELPSPILLLDIDRTLFDTDAFKTRARLGLARLIGCTQADIFAEESGYCANLSSSSEFDPEEFAIRLSRSFNFPVHALLSDYLDNSSYYQESVFPETAPVLRAVSPRTNLGIYSEGCWGYQINKLRQSGLMPWFDENLLFINSSKRTPVNLSQIPTGATIVDDKREVIDTLVAWGIHCLWINRTTDEIHPAAPTINNLSGLLEIFG